MFVTVWFANYDDVNMLVKEGRPRLMQCLVASYSESLVFTC